MLFIFLNPSIFSESGHPENLKKKIKFVAKNTTTHHFDFPEIHKKTFEKFLGKLTILVMFCCFVI